MLILASASPRRRELLERVGLHFSVEPADVDETPRAGEEPRVYAARVAADKARVVAERFAGATVLAADTVVIAGGDILAKAGDAAEARAMLDRLAGRTHVVCTAVALHAGSGPVHFAVDSEVEFRVLGEGEKDGYVASGEWRGKAGAYAIQGIGAALVRAVRGSYTNVVGLPLPEVIEALAGVGIAVDLASGRPA